MAQPENAPVQPARKLATADSFRQRATARDTGEVVELPSGLFVKIRRPSVTALIKQKHIPSDVAAAMQNVGPGKKMNPDDMTKYLDLVDLISVHSFVEPKVCPNGQQPGEGEITAEMIDDIDKQFVMNYVQSGVTDLTPFRTVAES
jgi:hypothetical protein